MKLGLIYPLFSSSDLEPPLGLASIATYLKKYMNFNNTRIIDVNFEDPYEVIRSWKPDILGISAMTSNYGDAIRTARKIKEEFDIPVLIGGVHISTLPSSLHEIFDMGVVGEGEQTMLELMHLYEQEGGFPEEKLERIKGLLFRKDGAVKYTGVRELIMPLDNIPIPDRSFMNEEYHKPCVIYWGRESYGRKAHILTSRGCPYRCTFCSTSKFWQTLRIHSPQHVYNEIKMLVENYKIDFIAVVDDLFTSGRERMAEIKKLLEEEGLLDRITLTCLSRVNLVDDELCELLKGLKVENLGFGFESGSNKTLKFFKKDGIVVDTIKNAVKTCHKHSITVVGSFILGSPEETLEDMEETVSLMSWMADEGVDKVSMYTMIPFPGTEIWEIAKERDKVSDDMDWELRNQELYDTNNPPLLDESIPIEDFRKIWEKANHEIEKMKNPKRRISRLLYRLRYEPVKTMKLMLYNPEKVKVFMRNILNAQTRKLRRMK